MQTTNVILGRAFNYCEGDLATAAPVATMTFKGRNATRQADAWETEMILTGFRVQLIPVVD